MLFICSSEVFSLYFLTYIKAFELGGVPLTKEEAQAVLTKVQDKNKDNAENNVYEKTINNQVFDAFLNGLILLARGPQKDKPIVDTSGHRQGDF